MSRIIALSLLVSSTAFAGTGKLTMSKKGLFPVRAFVDGQAHGVIKNAKKATVVEVEAGVHEVWYTADDDGVVTLCHGLVEVPEGGNVAVEMTVGMMAFKCSNMTPGYPNGPSAFKGSSVQFKVDSEVDAWVSIDGGRALALPSMPFELNLAPGGHTFVLYNDVMQDSVFDQGAVTLRGGERAMVTCTVAGCIGFDQPPIIIQEVLAAPQIKLAIPGVTIEVNVTE